METTLPVKPEKSENTMDKQTLLAVMQFLKKNNLKETQMLFKKEANIEDEELEQQKSGAVPSDVSAALNVYKSEGDPSLYIDHYTSLKNFIENELDIYKCELASLLYPIFIHMYLELVYNNHTEEAIKFFDAFANEQESYVMENLRQLRMVTKREQLEENDFIMENFRSSKFVIRMSRDSYSCLKRHLQKKKKNFLLNLIQDHLCIDVFEGIPRTEQQITAAAGALGGEAKREANKSKICYGLLKEPELAVPLEDDDDIGDNDDRPKKKKPKKELFSRKSKNDPNAPSINRVPLPDLRDSDKIDKITALREAAKRVKLSAECLPSICFYTFFNTHHSVTCVNVTEDSSMLVSGFADGVLRVYSLTPASLRSMKPASELAIIDKDADDVLERMMDDRTSSDMKVLLGHSGPVYSAVFSQDRNYIISCSEDTTIRLWSTFTYSCLVCYKGHIYPVWDVVFSPHGYYFASAGQDGTARLWATDHHQPIRLFVGHMTDVQCIKFHPNSNYVASGSSDRCVRLWDVLSGNCVRHLTGHKGAVQVLCFAPCGRLLASAGADGYVLVWDISRGTLVAQFVDHTDTIYSLCFSREGTQLASGGNDCCVKLWNMQPFNGQDSDEVRPSSSLHARVEVIKKPVGSFPTKKSPVLHLHFTRRNLLFAVGPFDENTSTSCGGN